MVKSQLYNVGDCCKEKFKVDLIANRFFELLKIFGQGSYSFFAYTYHIFVSF